MDALRRLFANGHSTPALAGELEIAVNDVLKEAEELCSLLRKRRETQDARRAANDHALNELNDA